MKKIGILTSAILLLTASAMAGYVIEYVDGTVTRYEKGRIHSGKGEAAPSGQGMDVMIMDLNAGTMGMVDRTKKQYFHGTMEELGGEMNSMLEMMRQAMGTEAAAMAGMTDKGAADKAKVEITKIGPGGKIAGYDTEHYKVTVDGELMEEIWIAPKLKVVSPAEADKMVKMTAKFTSSMSMGMAAMDYTMSPEYVKLIQHGFSVKQVKTVGMGIKVTNEVAKVTEKNILDSTYEMPKDCKKVSFLEMTGMGAMMGARK